MPLDEHSSVAQFGEGPVENRMQAETPRLLQRFCPTLALLNGRLAAWYQNSGSLWSRLRFGLCRGSVLAKRKSSGATTGTLTQLRTEPVQLKLLPVPPWQHWEFWVCHMKHIKGDRLGSYWSKPLSVSKLWIHLRITKILGVGRRYNNASGMTQAAPCIQRPKSTLASDLPPGSKGAHICTQPRKTHCCINAPLVRWTNAPQLLAKSSVPVTVKGR